MLYEVITPVAPAVENATPTEKPTTVATTAAPTEKPTTVATTVPPTPEPTQQSPGFGAMAALAGLGAVAFFALRRN